MFFQLLDLWMPSILLCQLLKELTSILSSYNLKTLVLVI